MKTRSLTIVASGLDVLGAAFADRFFEAGCDDATVALQKGLFVLEFDREARTFTHALVTAMRDILRAGASIERVEPDYLVSASEISKRSGLSRAAVSLCAKGECDRGFPHPVVRITSESPLYDWAEVASWLHKGGELDAAEVVQARTVREVNRYVTGHQLGASYVGRQLRSGRTPAWEVDNRWQPDHHTFP